MVTPRMSDLDLLAVDRLTTRLIAAAADGSTGTVVAIALAGGRRHLSGSAHRDIAAAALGTATDARTMVASLSSHRAAVDGDVATVSIAAAADACTTSITTLTATIADGSHSAAGDGNVVAVAVAAVRLSSASANTGTTSVTGSGHRAAGDGDVFAIAPFASADARTTVASGSSHRAAGDDNVLRSIIGRIAIIAAADAGTQRPTFGIQAAAAGFFVIVLQVERTSRRCFFLRPPS